MHRVRAVSIVSCLRVKTHGDAKVVIELRTDLSPDGKLMNAGNGSQSCGTSEKVLFLWRARFVR